MRFRRNVRIFRGDFDAAPVASVVFLLVALLLLDSWFVFPPGLKIEIPEATGLPGAPYPRLVVAIDAAGQFYYRHQAIAENQLEARLAEAVRASAGPLTLLVIADKSTSIEVQARLAQLARRARIGDTVWATRPPMVPAPGKM